MSHNHGVRVLCALFAIGASACSLGFDTFDPVAGAQDGGSGEGEAGVPVDATTDVTGGDDSSQSDTGNAQDSATQETGGGCPGQQACLTNAASCGKTCIQRDQQCTSMCFGPGQQQCRQACKTTEQSCESTCAQVCASCTSQAGCPDTTGCMTASQM
jgi:hypothetical protein